MGASEAAGAERQVMRGRRCGCGEAMIICRYLHAEPRYPSTWL